MLPMTANWARCEGSQTAIGPGVEQNKIIGSRGHARGDGRTFHAFEPAEFHRAGHERAGVARGNDGVRLAFADQFNGADHRGILFLPDAFDRFVIHRQHFGGMDDLRTRVA